MKNQAVLISLALMAAFASPAYAANTRTWISGTGVDQAGCGPVGSPCRTLQYAYDQTSTGGEINVKDSAGYGPVVINKSISIIADGAFAGVLAPFGGDAISIGAGVSDIVTLRGLNIEGAGVGRRGIIYYSGGTLAIANCVIQNFTNVGIVLQPTAWSPKISIINTTVSQNTNQGIYFAPPDDSTASATITVDHVVAANNDTGIYIKSANTSGLISATVSNSLGTQKTSSGIMATGPHVAMAAENVSADGNMYGISSANGATITIGRSSASNNHFFGFADNYATPGTILSYGDNHLSGNGSGPYNGIIGTAALH